jgi:hypothetical protein
MTTGKSISEINEKLAAGAIIDADGQIIEPEPTPDTTSELTTQPEESPESADSTTIPEDTFSPASASPQQNSTPEATSDPVIPSPAAIEEQEQPEDEQMQKSSNVPVIISIALVFIASVGFAVKKTLSKRNKASK